MRILTTAVFAAVLLNLASLALAQEAAAPINGQAEIGARVSSVSGDPARFQRYRDVRDGPTLDRARYERSSDQWVFHAALEHAGYRDQRYAADFNRYGKLKASFRWDQVPFFYSTDTRTPFSSPSPGVFRVSDAFQAAVQGGASTTSAYSPDLRRFDLRSLRSTAEARLDYRATPELDFRLSLTNTRRSGAQPWGASFGQSNAVELAAPLDRRNNDLNATAEWSNDRLMGRLAYDGSWFNNHVDRLIFDNPLRATDAVGGPSQGQQAQWPDSTAQTVSAAGAVTLPGRSRAFGYVSIGSWLQNEALLPFTINTAIVAPALSRPTADAEARIVGMTYRLTSRPTPHLWLNGQFKSYDYDNRTPRFLEAQYVGLDSTIVTSATGGSEPFGYVRRFVDVDASYTPATFMAFRLGYGREHADRTFRHFEATTEHTVRASIDSAGLAWGSMRLQYEHGERTGAGLDEEVFSDIGEQVSLRQFDISNRRRDRLLALVQIVPAASIGLNASAGFGQEHRPDAAFGLQDNDLYTLSVGIDAARENLLVLGAAYSFEHYGTLQRSRQASPGPQFNDPTRDWATDMSEGVHTVTGSLDLPHVASRTAARIAYDYVHADARYQYVLPANTSLAQPQPLPPILNIMRRATAAVRYTVSRQVGVALGYWYDRYDVRDFARSPGTLDSPFFSALINLMNLNRPYTAHTASVRLLYAW